MEQELDLIIGKKTKSQFLKNWSLKYVPAILLYATTSTKRSIKKLVEVETYSKHTILNYFSECTSLSS